MISKSEVQLRCRTKHTVKYMVQWCMSHIVWNLPSESLLSCFLCRWAWLPATTTSFWNVAYIVFWRRFSVVTHTTLSSLKFSLRSVNRNTCLCRHCVSKRTYSTAQRECRNGPDISVWKHASCPLQSDCLPSIEYSIVTYQLWSQWVVNLMWIYCYRLHVKQHMVNYWTS